MCVCVCDVCVCIYNSLKLEKKNKQLNRIRARSFIGDRLLHGRLPHQPSEEVLSTMMNELVEKQNLIVSPLHYIEQVKKKINREQGNQN